MTYDLTKKAGKGIAWNLLGQAVQQMTQFLVIVILARLLTPVDFGIFGMAVIFANFFQPFQQWGFQAFLIQKKGIDHEYESTAFWSMFIIGCVLFVTSISIAPFIGIYFNNPRVGPLIAVIAIGFLFSPVGAMQWALANRELRFKSIAIIDMVVILIYGFSVCALAFKGFGVWALVIATLVRELAWSVIFWFVYYWRPRFKFNITKLREMIGFSASCTGSGVVSYAINNIDNLLVGKYLGAANLGFYSLAFNTVSYPQNKLLAYVESITLPIFSLIQDNREQLRDLYLKIVKTILLIITPILSILFISAREFVLVLYGEKWLFAVVPIQIMCFYGLISAASFISGPIFLSKGRPDIDFKINILKLALFTVFLFFGLKYGIVGVSAAVLLYSVASFFPTSYCQNRLTKMDNLKFYLVVLRYIAIYFLVIGIIWSLDKLWFSRWCGTSYLWHLILKVISGLIIYMSFLTTFLKSDLTAFLNIFKKTFL